MSVTPETSQEEMSPLKEEASLNMTFISVTDEVFQEEMSPLKEEAPSNMNCILDTSETFQDEMLPLKEEAPRNIECMSETPDRSGTSVARYSMFDAPLNMPSMLDHSMSPHWSTCFNSSGVLTPAVGYRRLIESAIMMRYWPGSA